VALRTLTKRPQSPCRYARWRSQTIAKLAHRANQETPQARDAIEARAALLHQAWLLGMIAAGVNAKALSTFTGHANISITLDRYGHLMPGAEDEAAGLMDAYLQAAKASAT